HRTELGSVVVNFAADECCDEVLVAGLRSDGHDVSYAMESSPGADDRTVLQHAHAEQRILLTEDKDFGELVVRLGLPAPPSFRRVATRISRLIASRCNPIRPPPVNAFPLAFRPCFPGHYALPRPGAQLPRHVLAAAPKTAPRPRRHRVRIAVSGFH